MRERNLTFCTSTNGTINASYSFVKRPGVDNEQPPQEFFVRQLPFPVVVTVYQMIECSGLNLLPLSAVDFGDAEQRKEWVKLMEGTNEFDWCLLTLDVQNTYGLPFEVTLSCDSKGTELSLTQCQPYNDNSITVASMRIVSPGSTYK